MILILIGYLGVYLEEGFPGVRTLLNPFNITNFIVLYITTIYLFLQKIGVTNYFSLFCVSVVYIKNEGGHPKDWVGGGVSLVCVPNLWL